jgi:hypothetical protein
MVLLSLGIARNSFDWLHGSLAQVFAIARARAFACSLSLSLSLSLHQTLSTLKGEASVV